MFRKDYCDGEAWYFFEFIVIYKSNGPIEPPACSDANFGMFIALEQRKFGSPIPSIPFSLIPTIYDFTAFFAKHAAIFDGLLFTEELTVLIPR